MSEIVNVVARFSVVAGIGFVLEYRGVGFHSETLSRLAMLIGTPSLVFSTLTSTSLPDDSISRVVMLSIASVILGGALAYGSLSSYVFQCGLSGRHFPFPTPETLDYHWCFLRLPSLD